MEATNHEIHKASIAACDRKLMHQMEVWVHSNFRHFCL